MTISADAIVTSMQSSMAGSTRSDKPYKNWLLQRCLPDDVAETLLALPFPPPVLGGISG